MTTELNSAETFEPIPPMPQYTPHAVPPKKKRRFLMPLLLAGALLLGAGVGAAAVPEKTVEVTKEVPVEKVVEKSVAVPTTPKACTDALDYAATIFSMSADAMGVMQDMVGHAGSFDAAGLDADSAKLNKKTEDLGKLKTPYQDAVAECRAAG